MPSRCRRCDEDLALEERSRGLCEPCQRAEQEEIDREADWENQGDCLRDEGLL